MTLLASKADFLDLSKNRVLVTGSAGFIGFHLARTLLEQGYEVFSIDSVNDYYAVDLKEKRLEILGGNKYHQFTRGDLTSKQTVETLFARARPDIVVHLAAQAGVRYSLTHPQAYIDSNIQAFQNIIDAAQAGGIKHLVYASSSSVYGMNARIPFSEEDPVQHPLSLYAATKKMNEMMAHSYSNIYGLPTTGLRFFTAYGPWGRPDMAMFMFAKAILAGQPINVFNNGKMRRDFTFIDDVVHGVMQAMVRPPQPCNDWDPLVANPSYSRAPWRIYNLGNNNPCDLMYLIGLIEKELGREAIKNFQPLQPGDVPEACARIDLAQRDLDFRPQTPIEAGIHEFINWFKSYHGL